MSKPDESEVSRKTPSPASQRCPEAPAERTARRRPSCLQPALPWAPRPLALGTELMVEVETEDGQGWVSAEVSMAHGGHQYTLLVHPIEDDDYALPARPAAGAAAGAAAAAEGAAAAAAAGAPPADKRRAAAAIAAAPKRTRRSSSVDE